MVLVYKMPEIDRKKGFHVFEDDKRLVLSKDIQFAIIEEDKN